MCKISEVTQRFWVTQKHTLPCFCEHQVWSSSIHLEQLKTYLAVFRKTQVWSFNSWFVNGGIAIESASNLAVCQVCGQQGCMARKPVSRKVRRSASQHAGRSVRNTILLIFVSLREGFSLSNAKTDSWWAIHALPSVWIFCFSSVGHLLYGYFICATLKYAIFFSD